MKKIIRFQGLTLNRDEQAVEPGELALCGGVELYDGALRPSVLEGTLLAEGNDLYGTMIYIHKTDKYTNFITKEKIGDKWHMYFFAEKEQNGHTIWSGDEISIPAGSTFSPDDIVDINSVGNTLCVLTTEGLFYILCKYDNDQQGWKYKYLGQQPPFVELQFSLHLDTNDSANLDIETITTPDGWLDKMDKQTVVGEVYAIAESERSSVTEQVLSAVNRRISALTAEGYFYAPFFIRYAYRMHDNKSYIMQSPPVLLFPLLYRQVLSEVLFFGISPEQDANKYCIYVQRCSLKMQIMSTTPLEEIMSDWSDVIKSVDIFVTPQVSRIDTSGLINTCTVNLFQKENPTIYDGEYLNNCAARFYEVYGTGVQGNHVSFDLPEYGEDEHMAHIKNSASFYQLASYEIQEMERIFHNNNRSFVDVEFDGAKLSAITTQTQLTDDYKTHNLLKPANEYAGLYVYNHRLNVHGIGETLFNGFSPWVMFPYMGQVGGADTEEVSSVKVWINTEYGLKVVEKSISAIPCPVNIFMLQKGFVFYPDDRAVRMRIYYDNDTFSIVRKMQECSFLNGAYSMAREPASVDPTASTDVFVPMNNKLYTSRSDNPFYFPNLPGESGINTLGTGIIIGVAAVTRALSQGQVGDHDLVVFATDGIWVMNVSDKGTYSNMHNIAREVCVNKKSICQLDQSIIFATNRSLSQFYESDVASISEVLDGPIRSFADLLSGVRATDAVAQRLIDYGTPATTLYHTGRVLYDYTSSRLIVFPKDTSVDAVALVYSIRDKAWSTMAISAIKAALPGYPSPYIQFGDGRVKCLDSPYTYSSLSDLNTGIIMSRTLTFSDSMDVIRGFRQLTDAATMPTLYFFGSDDQRSWQLIGSSARSFHNYIPGHPFRFFRFAIYMRMHTDEKYQELMLEVINKYAKL